KRYTVQKGCATAIGSYPPRFGRFLWNINAPCRRDRDGEAAWRSLHRRAVRFEQPNRQDGGHVGRRGRRVRQDDREAAASRIACDAHSSPGWRPPDTVRDDQGEGLLEARAVGRYRRQGWCDIQVDLHINPASLALERRAKRLQDVGEV